MLKKFNSCQKGAAAVEFAIVLPLLVLLMGGIIEFGIILYDQQVLNNATREGVRAAINTIPSSLTVDQVKEIVVDYCKNGNKFLTISFSSNTFDTTNVNVVNVPCDEDDDVVVSATFTYHLFLPKILFPGNTFNLTSTTTMMCMK